MPIINWPLPPTLVDGQTGLTTVLKSQNRVLVVDLVMVDRLHDECGDPDLCVQDFYPNDEEGILNRVVPAGGEMRVVLTNYTRQPIVARGYFRCIPLQGVTWEQAVDQYKRLTGQG